MSETEIPNQFYRLFRPDHHGAFGNCARDLSQSVGTEHGRSLLLFESLDGWSWPPSRHSLVKTFSIMWTDGVTEEFGRLEMPKLLFQEDRPSVLSLAAKSTDDRSFLVIIPLLVPREPDMASAFEALSVVSGASLRQIDVGSFSLSW